MSGTASVPRGTDLLRGLAAVTSVLVIAGLSACSGDLLASSKPAHDSGFDPADVFDANDSSSLRSLIGHSPHVAPTGNWDGSIDGMKTLWYDSGVKRGEGRFVKGIKEDAWTFWYESGQKRWEGTYKNDLVQGVERSWYPNGTLCYEGTSVDGRRNGAFRAWYEDGQHWWKGEYRVGVRQGPFQYWRRDGSPDEKVSGIYLDGKRVKSLDGKSVVLAMPE